MSDAPFPRTSIVDVRLDDDPRYKGSVHDDAVARAKGFRAALVPGAFVYGYVSRLAIDAFGPAFAAHGAMSTRFRQPVFNGDRLTVAAGPLAAGPLDTGEDFLRADVSITNAEGTLVALCHVAMPVSEAAAPPELDTLPVLARPAEVPPIAAGDLRPGQPTTSTPFVFTREMLDRSLDAFAEDHPLYRGEGVAHSGCLMRLAMDQTNKSFRFPAPVILVEASVQHFAQVRAGDRLATSGRILDTYERNGRHYFVSEEYLIANADTVAARFRRTTIYA